MLPEIFRAQSGRDILLLCLVTLLVYGNALHGSFQFDDYNVIVNNPRVHAWPGWWQDISTSGIRPLLKLSYLLDWSSGLGVAGFHMTNLLIHCLNVILAYRLTCAFLAVDGGGQAQRGTALFAALLFALHPALTEAVTYISGRSSALMTLFYLAGVMAYALGRESGKTWQLHGVVPLCMLLSLLTKETAITFPAALWLWEGLKGGTLKQAMRRQWVVWILLAASLMFVLLHPGYAREMRDSFSFNTLTGKLATQLLGFIYLMRQWCMPFWPNIDPELPVLGSFQGLLLHAFILFGMLVLMVFSWRRRPWLAFSLAWTMLQLLPIYLVLPRLDVVNDRQLYLVAWPLAMAIAIPWGKLEMPHKQLLGVAILTLLAFVTVKRNQDYRNEIALWEATARLSPGKARVQNNLGYALMRAGRHEEARQSFETALTLDPTYYRARYNLLLLGDGE